METVEYAAGRHADVFGETSQPTVLLWHGQQPDARSSVRRLAELIAGHGVGVIAPDWNSYADDGGRADLLRSVQFARERVHDPDDLVLVGWSMGGLAAAGLTVHAQRLDMAFAHTVCLAGAFMVPDPIFNELPASQVNADPVHPLARHGRSRRPGFGGLRFRGRAAAEQLAGAGRRITG
jgi:alpha-beta hydrolase superfamily lysophospholipase